MAVNRRTNILFIHANNYDVGGADYCLLKLVTALDTNRFNPMVVLGLDTEIAEKYRAYGIPLTIVSSMLRISKSKSILYYLQLLVAFIPTVIMLVGIIRRHRIDIVHSNDLMDIYGPMAARLAGAKAIQHDRLIIPKPVCLRKFCAKLALFLNHRVVVVSNGVAREMFGKAGRTPRKVITCYDWLDMDKVGHNIGQDGFRNEIGCSDEHILVGAVGRLEYWKGQHLFIHAAARVAEAYPEARFVVVGGPVAGRRREGYEDELRKLAWTLKINDRLYFTGHRTDIANIMSSLDIYVHSSIEPDPLPGVVMEAMALRKPVVGPRAGGVPEEVEEGVTGLLYEPGNAKEMAKAVCDLIASPKLAQKFGRAARGRADYVFNKEALVSHIEGVYEDILNGQ